jgi:hypothetical protein
VEAAITIIGTAILVMHITAAASAAVTLWQGQRGCGSQQVTVTGYRAGFGTGSTPTIYGNRPMKPGIIP